MNVNETPTPWVIRYKTATRPRARLFCFPYAGGAAHIFRQWPQGLPPTVEVCAVQPPGRGSRLTERPITSLRQLVAEAMPPLRPYMNLPFAFFGHSMGAVVAFELAHHLRGAGAEGPAQLFVSGCRAPQLAGEDDVTYNLPEPEFLAEIRRLTGTPPEVLEQPELLELVLPLLRADFTAIQTYEYSEVPPLPYPLTVFGGVQDEDVDVESLKAWRVHTTAAFSLHMLPGNHFFLRDSQPLLLKALTQDLQRLTGTSF